MLELAVVCLSVLLLFLAALVVGAYVMTRRSTDASRRCAILATELDRKVKERDMRIAVLRDELERTKVERDAVRVELANLLTASPAQ